MKDRVDVMEEETRIHFATIEEKANHLQEEIDILKKRPVPQANQDGGSAEINFDMVASRDELMDLIDRIQLIERRNIEQDERLTNNELRIEKLEKAISDPMDRIMALEQRLEAFYMELKNRVTVQDLYNELLKKADVNGLKALEASLIRLNDIINDLAN